LLKKKADVLGPVRDFVDANIMLSRGVEWLEASGMLADSEIAMLHYAQRPTTLYVGMCLSAMGRKIRM